MWTRGLSLLALSFALCAGLSAQAIHVVGPGGFGDLQSAYNAAAPGDILLLRVAELELGTLSGKGVVILGDGMTPELDSCHAVIENIPAGQMLLFDNVRIHPICTVFCLELLPIRNCAGSVVFQATTIDTIYPFGIDPYYGTLSFPALHISGCDDVQFIGSTIRGNCPFRPGASTICQSTFGSGGPAILAADSTLSFSNCTIRGGYGCVCPYGCFGCWAYWRATGGDGLQLTNCRVAVVDSILEKGLGAGGGADGTSAVLRGTSVMTLSPPPADAVSTASPSVVYLYGGTGGVTGTGQLVADSRPLPVLRAQLTGTQLAISSQDGRPGAVLFLGASLRSAYIPLEPLAQHGTILMDLDRARSLLLDIGIYDSSGAWSRTYSFPAATVSALANRHFMLQCLSVDPQGGIWASSAAAIRF